MPLFLFLPSYIDILPMYFLEYEEIVRFLQSKGESKRAYPEWFADLWAPQRTSKKANWRKKCKPFFVVNEPQAESKVDAKSRYQEKLPSLFVATGHKRGGEYYLISVLRIASAIHTKASSCLLDSRQGVVRILNFTFKWPTIVSTRARTWWMVWLYDSSAFVNMGIFKILSRLWWLFWSGCKISGLASASFPNWSADLPQQLHRITSCWAGPYSSSRSGRQRASVSILPNTSFCQLQVFFVTTSKLSALLLSVGHESRSNWVWELIGMQPHVGQSCCS